MSIKSIIEAETNNFLELANLANLDVKQDFAGADLSDTNLGGLDLKEANFRSTNFRKTNLEGTNLRDAILVRANLRDANLTDAILVRANLQDANLQNANLNGVDFEDVDLTGADLSHAQLVGTKNLLSARVVNTRFKYNNGISKNFELELIKNGAFCEGNLPFKQHEISKSFELELIKNGAFCEGNLPFKQWLGKLLDDLISWLGRAVAAFLQAFVNALQAIWDVAIATVLIAAFGYVSVLYAIFYAGAVLGETFMEVWDPRFVTTKQSKVFRVKQAPQKSPLPTQRSNDHVIILENALG